MLFGMPSIPTWLQKLEKIMAIWTDDTTISEHKNRMGQLSWYLIYNKMQGEGLLKGNKDRKRKER
jgi:hypothetical protein